MAGPESARMVLRNPWVEVAVLETARGGIVRSGLGFDRCNVAVVTNVASDHLGIRGVDTIEDLARVKAVVPQSVLRHGVSVLNADNEWTVKMADTARGEIIFFSMDEHNAVVREHVRRRGRAVILRQTPRGGMITLLDAIRDTNILLAREIPAALDERIQVNVANALAATAAAIGVDTPLASIRTALRTFSTAFWQTPGRFNLLTVDDRQVVVDYCHNAHGLEGIADFVRRTAAPQAVGVIAIPGDRRDEDMHALGELAGRTFDWVIIREPANLRGRRPGEVAGLLRDAAIAGGLCETRVLIVLDEMEAIDTAIEVVAPGDLVVAMVTNIAGVWDAFTRRATAPATPVEGVLTESG